MATLIATAISILLLGATGVLLLWALSAVCRFLAALMPGATGKASQ